MENIFEMASLTTTTLTEETLDTLVRHSEGLVVVGAFRSDCSNSLHMLAALTELSWFFTRVVRFCLIDVRSAPALAFRLGIYQAPTVVLLNSGVEVERVGRLDKIALREFIEARLGWAKQESHCALPMLSHIGTLGV